MIKDNATKNSGGVAELSERQSTGLLPCPFCGAAGEYDDPMLPERSLVGCSNFDCITRKPIRNGRKEWNTRAESLLITQLAEALRRIEKVWHCRKDTNPKHHAATCAGCIAGKALAAYQLYKGQNKGGR